ncbi:hypothetical protein KBD71_00415 [Candidatus Woesebacteria bacterium]|nr:hypothetical protein [Candidatus Woesebacteria bacterium]
MSATLPSVDHLFYFGRFNVAHHGYISVMKLALALLSPTYGITIVPSPDTPTWGEYTLPFKHRVHMLQEACKSELTASEQAKIHISDIELELLKQGIDGNFSINTLHVLREQIPPTQSLGIVMGADAATSFTRWKNWQEILQIARLYIVPRAALQTPLQIEKNLSPTLTPYLQNHQVYILPADPRFLSALSTQASSTAVLAGKHEYLPASVQHYTQQQQLL